jgi:hypothetical protein
MLRHILSAAALAACLLAARADDPAPLRWKLQPGTTFFAERRATRTETVAVNGRDFKQEAATTWLVKLTARDPADAGAKVAATLVTVTHQVRGATAKEGLDSQLAEKMHGATFTLVVTPAGKVAEFGGYPAFVERLAGAAADKRKVIQATVPEDALREAFGDLFVTLPETPVGPGTKWTRTAVEPIPFFGAFHSTYRYECASARDDRYDVGYTIRTKYERPRKGDDLVRVVKGELEGQDGRGHFRFDAARGRLVENERSMTVRGRLTLETAGRQSAVQFTSENRVKVRVSDRPPGE